jgi:hypothetical protein
VKVNVSSAARAAALAIIVLTVLTIISELMPALNDFLKKIAYHHWIAKSVIVLVVYFIFSWIWGRSQDTDDKASGAVKMLVIVTVINGIVIFGFNTIHTILAK